MKTIKVIIFTFLILIFSLHLSATVNAVGDSVYTDSKGNTIYRTKANGIDIGYKLMGEGDPLVLINGLGMTTEQWPDNLISKLSAYRQLILIDNRGIGFSTVDSTEFNNQLFADDVISVLKALNIKEAEFLGFSMGSVIVQEIIINYPEMVQKAILYATSTNGAMVVKTLKGKIPDNPIVKRQIKATQKHLTPLDKLARFENPVLLVIGSNDVIVGINSSILLAEKLKKAKLVKVPDATHKLMFEQPEYFTEIVTDFLLIKN